MAITAVPGQSLSQQELDALVAQHGGQPSGQTPSIQGRSQAQIDAAALAGDPDPTARQRPVYRYVLADGSYIDVRDSPDGQRSEVVKYEQSPAATKAAAKTGSGTTTQVEGTPDPSKEGGFDNGRPRMVTRGADGAITEARPLTKAEREEWQGGATNQDGVEEGSEQVTDANGRTTKVTTYRRADGTTYTKTASVQAAPKEPEKPQVVAGTLNTTSPQYAVVAPDGSVTWTPNPNYQNPAPKPITLPNTRTIVWDNGDGTTRTEKNPHYVKPSKLVPHPSDPRKWVNVTEDDNGNPVILPVDDKTAVKPADLPVLQSKYGEIAQGLGALAQDLNGRVARQEITPQERTEAFTAAYQQAQTQVSELNSILENSKAIWSGQVTQRGQTLQDTQGRRSFASDAAGRAITTGMNIATSAGPGHGQAIARGVEALMGMQQQYAQGMGGFRESPEIGLPPALEQARGIGLPGYPMPGGPPAPPSGPPGGAGGTPGPAGAPPPPPPSGGPPPSGISNTTDAGGVPRVYTPASVTGGGSGTPPPPPPDPGFSRPDMQAPPTTDPGFHRDMGARLEAAQGYAGGPVAGGDVGMWDPSMAVQGMLGQGGDAAWEEAVRRAAGSFGMRT